MSRLLSLVLALSALRKNKIGSILACVAFFVCLRSLALRTSTTGWKPAFGFFTYLLLRYVKQSQALSTNVENGKYVDLSCFYQVLFRFSILFNF